MGLSGLLVVFFFIILALSGARQAIQRQRDDLVKQVESLTKQNEGISQELRRLQDLRNSLQRELDKISQEKEEIQRKYDLAAKEKEALIEKLKTRPAVTKEIAVTLPQTNEGYWGEILKAKTDLELQLDSIRSELKTIQINNEQLQRDKAALELEIKNLNRENEDLKRQLNYNQKITDTLSQELVREKNDKFKIQDSLKSIKSENEILRRQLKSLDNRKINLEEKLLDLQKENDRITARLNEMEMLLQDKMLRIDNLKKQLEAGPEEKITAQEEKESIELPPIVVRPQTLETPSVQPHPSLVGKILAVNRENNFVIIDLGQNKGVKMGDTFQVYQQEDVIASLEVTQARREIAACDIKRETTPIKVGDTVR